LNRPIYQYQPLNDSPDQAIGVSLPFNKSAAKRNVDTNYASGSLNAGSVFAQTFSTEEQAISNLKNLLLTRKGERVMQPNFGTAIYDSLFEANTDTLLQNLKSSIRDDIEFWLPYIIINDIDAIRSDHRIDLRLHFRTSENGANLVINVLASENNLVTSDATIGV
tara:strand:+ start:79 stop:573 length:495 start_codon:yes stop_codon:yes gene_type:complete